MHAADPRRRGYSPIVRVKKSVLPVYTLRRHCPVEGVKNRTASRAYTKIGIIVEIKIIIGLAPMTPGLLGL
ncbi:hypothetical protein BDV36DRAFT_175050 [Aspergillus pseudocaelatus]|uniref:Uncharacterized protein n=1 Tax=Aspergillus pseudocaelatus TaxID=1825620 RepID=A0ABQ6X106_9EURO|nr:hypothetical protein BDV36DRAFT_175050 [Aspergillus pseudocaelatus]